MTAPLAALFLSTLLSQAAPPARKEASALNTQGFRHYQKKQFPEALALFRKAFEVDPTHSLARYNYAATLGVLRKQNRTCEFEAHKQAIVEQLTQAAALDPTRKRRMVTDRDFDDVRDTVGYQRLLGLDPTRPKDLPALLERVTWHSAGEGAYGSLRILDLQPRGKLTLTVRQVVDDAQRPIQEKKVLGTWRLEGTTLRLTLREPLDGVSAVSGTLTPQGLLQLEAPLGSLQDHPSECEA